MYTRVGSQDLRLGNKCLGFEVGSRDRVPSMDLNVGSKCISSKVVSQVWVQKADSDDLASSFGPEAGSQGTILRLHSYARST